MSKKIGVMVGSLRAESFNKKAAKAIVELLPQDFEVEFLEIGNLPFYNEEFDVETPEIIEKFREKITEKDGFIIFTPEYNRSVAPALKNAIDIATRP
ncbi:NADPH-dependent FMN reductase [Helcococcus kunzii]